MIMHSLSRPKEPGEDSAPPSEFVDHDELKVLHIVISGRSVQELADSIPAGSPECDKIGHLNDIRSKRIKFGCPGGSMI